jgi:hypothetical protein
MRFIYITVCALLFAYGCKTETPKETCNPPSGRFINYTVLQKCPGAMPADEAYFCFELNFKRTDTVDVDNGFERFSLPFKVSADGCYFTIAGATLFGDMVFRAEGDSILQLIDTAWTKLETFSTFKKYTDPERANWSFQEHLNDCLLAGQYSLFREGNLVPHVVDVLSNGQINGLKPFLGYSICYAGDCLEETDPPARTIDFIDERGGKETFAFKLIDGKKSIEFYSIGPPIPDIKGGRSIGPMVYELRTE